MRNKEIPPLSFSPWFAWEDRSKVPLSKMPGIYLISITLKDLKGETTKWEDVSYIGMTNSRKGLLGRWQQFFNSITGKRGHSGGNKVYKNMGHYDDWDHKLFVSAMPIECNVKNPNNLDLIKMGWVAFLEYEAFAEFYNHFPKKVKPEYNTK